MYWEQKKNVYKGILKVRKSNNEWNEHTNRGNGLVKSSYVNFNGTVQG